MLTGHTAIRLGQMLAAREVGAVEVARAHLDRISAIDGKIGALLWVDEAETIRRAELAQALLDAGTAGPLTGVPYLLKDNMSTKGIPTTCGSRILEGYVPPYSATVHERLENAGMVLLGKTNLDEFAMGTSTEFSAFHPTRNPWDLNRSPGGSSGGSAAAVAAQFAPIAFGSDTGGSIRQPAALCGVVGFKPTYGRVSRYGLVAFASSLDQIGPFARSVEDAAAVSSIISGHDPLEATSIPSGPIDITHLRDGKLRGLKAAIPTEMMGDAISPGVNACIQQTIELLENAGVEVQEVSLPSIRFGVTTYYIIAPAEASSNLARFDGIRYGPRLEGHGHVGMVEATRGKLFGHEVKSRIMIGTYALSAGYYDAYYVRAMQVRSLMVQELMRTFQDFDMIISPTSPVTAFKLGELKDDPIALKMLDYCTIPANLAGMPGISINCGFSEGLPVGLQTMAAPMRDEALLQVAFAIEQLMPDATRSPQIA